MHPAKLRRIFILVVVLTSICNVPCQARTTFIPFLLLNLQTNYDSNFYYLPANEKSVVTQIVEPGFEFSLETAKVLIAAQYILSANYYNQSGEDNFYGHKGFLSGKAELTDRMALEIKNQYFYTRDPALLDPLGIPAFREPYSQNRFRAALSYHFEPKFTLKVGYQNWITDYDRQMLEDAYGNQGSIDLIYHLNRASAIDIAYEYWSMDYDGTTPDYISQLLWLKYRKEWRIIALEVGFGYHVRDYDEPGLDATSTPSYNLILDGASKSGKSRYSLTGEQNYNYLGFHNSDYYIANRLSGTFDYDWTERITTGVEAAFQNNDYVFQPREDDVFLVEGEVKYFVKDWLDLIFSLSYEERTSTFNLSNYDRMVALFELQFDYDIGFR